MVLTDFGLARRPFPATPDRTFYYPSTTHETTLANLLRAIEEDAGFALLAGDPGTGKTLLCHCLLERLGPNVVSAFLSNSHFPDRLSLLQGILFDFSLPYEDGREQVLRLRLTDYLLKNCSGARRTILLVDEAQHLSPDLLEELRLLGNLEAGQGKAFQVILAGQEGLMETLSRPEMTACLQRLAVRARIEPLGIEEGVDYLLHHVRVAGGNPDALWEEPALEILARGAKGIPRLLNQAAHQAMLLAHQAEMSRIDAEAALEALAMLGLEAKVEEGEDDGEGETLSVDGELAGKESTGVRLFDSPRRA
jgi:type II secretory pathway predicted ATPase ExeA